MDIWSKFSHSEFIESPNSPMVITLVLMLNILSMFKVSLTTVRIPTLVSTHRERMIMIGIVNLKSWSSTSLSKYHLLREIPKSMPPTSP